MLDHTTNMRSTWTGIVCWARHPTIGVGGRHNQTWCGSTCSPTTAACGPMLRWRACSHSTCGWTRRSSPQASGCTGATILEASGPRAAGLCCRARLKHRVRVAQLGTGLLGGEAVWSTVRARWRPARLLLAGRRRPCPRLRPLQGARPRVHCTPIGVFRDELSTNPDGLMAESGRRCPTWRRRRVAPPRRHAAAGGFRTSTRLRANKSRVGS